MQCANRQPRFYRWVLPFAPDAMLNGQTKDQLRTRNRLCRSRDNAFGFYSIISDNNKRARNYDRKTGSIRRATIKEMADEESKEAAARRRRRDRRRSSGRGRRIRSDRQKTREGRGRWRHPWAERVGTDSAFEEHHRRSCESILLVRERIKSVS